MLYISLILLFFCNVILVSLFKNKTIKIILSIFLSLFLLVQLSAIYIGGSYLDYKYYCHLDLSTFSMAKGFIVETILSLLLLILLPYMTIRSSNRIKSFKHTQTIKIFILFIGLSLLTFPQGSMVREIANMIRIISFSNKNIQSIPLYSELPKKQQLLVETTSGKNIIIISLESLERGYLHPSNKHITPFLQSLKESWNYTDMQITSGCTFTSASLYASLTGLPSFFAGYGNNYFHGATNYKLINLLNILTACGYDTYHISNNASFAGTKDLLTALGMQHILYGTYNGKYPECPLGGTYDMDMFTEAKNIIKQADPQHSYFIYLSTTQTHSPNGIIDERVCNIIGKENNDLETAVKSTDYLVKDFIQYLDSIGILSNTAIFIYPDHTFYGEKNIFIHKDEPRSLWLMSNMQLSDYIHSNFSQIDVPKLILDASHIHHNNKFLCELIPSNENRNAFINNNIDQITSINMYALERGFIMSEHFKTNLSLGKLNCLINNKEFFSYRIKDIKNKDIIILFDNKLKALQSIICDKSTNIDETYNYFDSYMYIKSNAWKSFDITWYSYPDNEVLYHQTKVKKAELDIHEIITILQKQEQNTINTQLTLFENKGYPSDLLFAHSDTIHTYLHQLIQDTSNIIFVTAYDEASVHFDSIRYTFHNMGLKENLSNKYRWEYVAAFSKDTVYFEKTDYRMLYKKGVIDSIPYIISSCCFDHLQTSLIVGSYIVINGKDYSTNHRGLNFVVYNKAKKDVIDAFYIDTNADSQLTIHRRQQ